MKRTTRRTLLIGVAVVFAGGAAGSWLLYWGKRTYGLTRPEEMEHAITAAVPVGSPVAAAEALLRREGFRRATWGDQATEAWYTRDDKDGWFVSRGWKVRVDHRRGASPGMPASPA